MLIIGAGGFAKELLDVCEDLSLNDKLCFYDDINLSQSDLFFNKYKILTSLSHAKSYFESVDKCFTIGIGNPRLRQKFYKIFSSFDGLYTSTISPLSTIGHYDVSIGQGTNILPGAIVSNSVTIGIGNIIYYGSIITHDVKTGDFVEISPGAKLLGGCEIGDFCSIGSNATILPNVKVGNNVIVGAGSVVTKDIKDDMKVAGVPAREL